MPLPQVFLHWRLETRRRITPAAHSLRAALMQQRSSRRLARAALTSWKSWTEARAQQRQLVLAWAGPQTRKQTLSWALTSWYRWVPGTAWPGCCLLLLSSGLGYSW